MNIYFTYEIRLKIRPQVPGNRAILYSIFRRGRPTVKSIQVVSTLILTCIVRICSVSCVNTETACEHLHYQCMIQTKPRLILFILYDLYMCTDNEHVILYTLFVNNMLRLLVVVYIVFVRYRNRKIKFIVQLLLIKGRLAGVCNVCTKCVAPNYVFIVD